MDKNTDEERKAAAEEWFVERVAEVEAALREALRRGKKTRIDLLKFALYAWKDHQVLQARNSNMRPLYCDILIAAKKRYPPRSNRYYWTKKGQPKLWKIRKRIGHHLTKTERHYLFPMPYLELRD